EKDSTPSAFPESSSFAARVVRYIMNHLDQELGLNILAKQFHISRSHLRRRFQEETGISLGEYIRRSRITKAMYHLNQKEKNIGEIAELCGYSSIQAFSRAFREKVNMTPLAYRAKQIALKRNHVLKP
ncbi:MAG: helix-turn-helix transcriptional regulator, partial [Lentisphaeria bacterium]|nr:helix-turn-helix transcriptional regulator [Lentisphaeria bacterium]